MFGIMPPIMFGIMPIIGIMLCIMWGIIPIMLGHHLGHHLFGIMPIIGFIGMAWLVEVFIGLAPQRGVGVA